MKHSSCIVIMLLLSSVSLLPTAVRARPPSNPPIPSTFFAMTLNGASGVTAWPMIGTLGKDNGQDWAFVNPSQGTYKWTSIDNDIATAKSHGVDDFIYTFLLTPTWASSDPGKACGNSKVPGGCAPPANLTYWTAFVTALATRYKGQIRYYEIWNEPNNPNSWTGSIQELLNLASSAYSIIHSIDSNAMVVTPGVAVAGVEPTSGSCLNTCYLEQYLQAGGGQYADAVSWHGYYCQTGVFGDCGNGIGCTEPMTCAGTPLLNQITYVEGYVQKYAPGKPIIDTEGGWGKNQNLMDPGQQAAYVSRWYILQASAGVEIATWYAWNGDNFSDSSIYGTLWAPSQGESRAAIAYNQTYHWLVGSSFNAPCSLTGSMWSCELTLGDGGQGLIVWSDSNSTLISYTPPSQYARYYGLAGDNQTIRGTIAVSDEPILLEGVTPGVSSSTSATESRSSTTGASSAAVSINTAETSASDSSVAWSTPAEGASVLWLQLILALSAVLMVVAVSLRMIQTRRGRQRF